MNDSKNVSKNLIYLYSSSREVILFIQLIYTNLVYMKNLSCRLPLLISLLLLAGIIKGQSFNFALVTDTHVTKDSLAYNDLKRTVDQINKTPDISFVLVTGDLTEEGDRASLEKVKSLLDQLNVKDRKSVV